MRPLKLRVNGSLHDYIDKFQGLAILWREINPSIQAEEKLVTQLVSHIEDPLFLGPCESIKNWASSRKTFCDAAATLRGHEIIKNVGQTKKNIENEVNSLLMGNCSVKRRATGEAKAIRGFKTGGQETKGSNERIPYKFWKMLSPDAQELISSGGEGKVGLVTEGGVNASSHGGGNFPRRTRVGGTS